MGSLNEANGIPKSIEEDFGSSAPAQRKTNGLCSFPEYFCARGPDECGTESSRKKIEQTAIFPDGPGVIHIVSTEILW